MIPQRNLSLLANRLHKEHGGRRIPEAVLERDYCLAWFLVGMGQSRLGQILTFKGGTALKRCHFGDYRFSEDLDFTLARPAEFAEIREGLEEVFERVAQASGIRFAFEREDGERHVNSHTFYLSYQGPLPNPNTVKVDITIAEVLLFPVEQRLALRDSQQAWLNYRQKQCEAVFDFWRSGTVAPSAELRCKIELTRSRMRDLDSLYEMPLHH